MRKRTLGFSFKLLFVLAVFAVSCSLRQDRPQVDTPRINYDLCRNAGLDLKKLEPASVRGLTKCLNGENKALQPFVDLLDEVTDDELTQLLEIYNKHLVTEKNMRLNKILDLVDRMEKRGLLKDIYADISVLTDAGVLQSALPILLRFIEAPEGGDKVDRGIIQLNRFFSELIRKNLISDGIRGVGKAMGSQRAKAMALLLSRAQQGLPLNSDQVTDFLAETFEKLVDEDKVHAVTIGASDPAVYRALLFEQSSDIEAAKDVLIELSRRSEAGYQKLEQIHGIAKIEKKPLICFKDQPNERRIDNLLDMALTESALRLREPDRLNRLYLVEVPLMLGIMGERCNRTPDEMRDLFSHKEGLVGLAMAGVAPGLAATVRGFYLNDRLPYVKALMGDSIFPTVGPLLETAAMRGLLPLALEFAQSDLTYEDFRSLSRIVTYYAVEDLRKGALQDWIASNFVGKPLQDLQALIEGQGPLDPSLLKTLDLVEKSKNLQLQKVFRDRLAAVKFAQSSEQLLLPVWRKLYTAGPQRDELKAMVKALVDSMGNPKGGLGDLIATLAEGADLSRETPVQEFFQEFLADEELMNRVAGTLLRIIQKENLQKAVAYTGTLAGNGEMARLVRFLVDVFKSSQESGLDSEPMPANYKKSSKNPNDLIVDHPFQPKAPKGDYAACSKIDGDLFGKSGENFYWALLCLDARSDEHIYKKVAEMLKQQGLLAYAADLIGRHFMTSPNVNYALDQLEALLDTGVLHNLLELVRLSAEKEYRIPEQMDPLLAEILNHSKADSILECAGRSVQSTHFVKGLSALVDVLGKTPEPLFQLRGDMQIPVWNEAETRKQALQIVQDGGQNWDSNKFEFQFKRALDEYQGRWVKNDYLFRAGMYKNFGETEMKAEILKLARELLYFKNLEASLQTFRDFAFANDPGYNFGEFANLKGLDVPKYLDWSVSTTRPILYWPQAYAEPELRIVSRFDQMEILVLNAAISVAFQPVGAKHMGIFYQIGVAKSNDLAKTLDDFAKTTKLGVKYTSIFQKDRHWRMLNNDMSMHVLVEGAHSGDLRLFQRFYQGLRWSTPDQWKDSQDPEENQMDWIHRPMPLGFFAKLQPILWHLHSKGLGVDYLRYLFNIGRSFDPKFFPEFRRVMTKLLSADSKGFVPFQYLLDRLFMEFRKNDSLINNNIATSFLHLVGAMGRMAPEIPGALEVAEQALENPELVRDVLDWVVDDMKKSDGLILKLSSNIIRSDSASLTSLKSMANIWMGLSPQTTGMKTCAGSVGQAALDTYWHQKEAFRKLMDSMTAYGRDPRVKQLGSTEIFKSFLSLIGDEKGIRGALKEILLDPKDRETFRQVMHQMAANGQFGKIVDDMAPAIQSGEIEKMIAFITKNLKRTK